MVKAMDALKEVFDSYQVLLNLLAVLYDARVITKLEYPTFSDRMSFASKFGPKTD